MATVNLHDVFGNLVELDALTMTDCKELPEYTEITAIQKVDRYSSKKVVLQVQEKREDIRKQLIENKKILATIPECLIRERKTFEQLRAERRKREAI